ncbi:MAG: carboxypeptidase regulatory-like domain-containing protein [Gemmatimonadales bacterium]
MLAIIVLALVSAGNREAQGQGSTAGLRGTVLDAETRRPVARAIIEIASQGRRTETDSSGEFRMDALEPQLVTVRLRSLGYRTVERGLNLYAGRVSRAEYILSPALVILPEVRVLATASATPFTGFEDRRRQGFGTFITAAELERHPNRRILDLVRGIPGVRAVRSTGGGHHLASNRRPVGRPGPGGNRPCFLQVVVDGMMYWSPDPGGEVSLRSGPPPDLGAFISTTELAGVEVYAGMTGVPVEFRRDGIQCGTMVLWTKRGGYRPPSP